MASPSKTLPSARTKAASRTAPLFVVTVHPLLGPRRHIA
jgi:hypothetical protein